MKILLRIVLAPVWLVCAVVKLASAGLRALSGWLFRGIGLLMLIVTAYCWYVQWADAGSLAYMLMGSLMFFFFSIHFGRDWNIGRFCSQSDPDMDGIGSNHLFLYSKTARL